MKHLKYLRYVALHKWFVFVACCQLAVKHRVPLLILRGIIHDWSKFLPCEWFPYVEFFYGFKPTPEDRRRAMAVLGHDPYPQIYQLRGKFDRAWLHHQHWNQHHWQHWILREDSGDTKFTAMPRLYALEMIADWHGAGRTITGKSGGTPAWYEKNYAKIQIHPTTRGLVDRELQICPF